MEENLTIEILPEQAKAMLEMVEGQKEPMPGSNGRDLRRALPGERKTWEPKNLWEAHHRILRLKFFGVKNTVIAKMVEMTPENVSMIVNSRLGKDKLSLMRGAADADAIDVKAEIEEMLPDALNVYKDILAADTTDPGISWALKKQTADTIVKDLGGHEAPKVIHGKHLHAHKDISEVLEDVKKNCRENAAILGVKVEGF